MLFTAASYVSSLGHRLCAFFYFKLPSLTLKQKRKFLKIKQYLPKYKEILVR